MDEIAKRLYDALSEMVVVYQEGQDDPMDEPQAVYDAIRAMEAYEEKTGR